MGRGEPNQQAIIRTFLYGAGNENHELCAGFLVHNEIISEDNCVEYISERM
jgi:hypothetical protein